MNSNINSPQKPQAEGETEGGDHVKLELEDEEAQEADSAGRRHGGCAVLSCTACTVLYCLYCYCPVLHTHSALAGT